MDMVWRFVFLGLMILSVWVLWKVTKNKKWTAIWASVLAIWFLAFGIDGTFMAVAFLGYVLVLITIGVILFISLMLFIANMVRGIKELSEM